MPLTSRSAPRLVSIFALIFIGACEGAPSTQSPANGDVPDTSPAPDVINQLPSLNVDPALVTGTLENGLRYAVYPNETPSEAGALWVRFDAGSFQETEDQLGLAHFLEHMAFNGSENVPEGEMVKILERLGLAFGADTNAFTAFDQTVYTLDLPNLQEDTLEAAFFLMRETAENLTITDGAVDRERGIILSEERARDTPGFRSLVEQLNFLYPDTLVPNRLPIGDMDIVSGPDAAAEMRAYYKAYYRPENTLVVFVGDDDPSAMEARIVEGFGDWIAPETPPGPAPDLGTLQDRPRDAGFFYDPGVRTSLSISTVGPALNLADTPASRYQALLVQLGNQILTRRLIRISEMEDAPFFGAQVSAGDQYDLINTATISLSMTPENWDRALETGEQELRRMLDFGVTQAELTETVANFAAFYQNAAARADTRPTSGLVQAIVAGQVEETVFTHPADDLSWFEAAAPTLTIEAINAAFVQQWSQSEPLMYLASSQPLDDARTQMLGVYDASLAVELDPPVETGEIVFAYTDFGAPGKIIERNQIEALDITQVRFANGVALSVKPTDFEEDVVRVSVRFGAGQVELPKDLPGLSILASNTYTDAGLAAHSADELRTLLAGKRLSSSFGVGEDAFVLSGQTRPQDLQFQLQLLTAYLTDPGFRPEALARIRQAAATFYDGLESTPGGLLQKDGAAILRSGDPRFGFPSEEAFLERNFDELAVVMERARGVGQIEIGIVGDVDVETAIAEIAATFGALPARETAPPAFTEGRDVVFPSGNMDPIVLRHQGEPNRGMISVAWPTTDDSDLEIYRQLLLLERVLSNRLLERVREAEGATYSPSANAYFATAFPEYGYINVTLDLLPADTERYFAIVDEIADSLSGEAVSQDELDRALEPLLQSLDEADESNPYWLSLVSRSQFRPEVISRYETRRAGFEAITPDQLLDAAQTYLSAETANRMLILPETGE